MNVNEIIRDLEVLHQVYLSRLSTNTLQKVRKLLDRADAEIVETLIRRGAATQGSYTSKRLALLLNKLREIGREVSTELGKAIRTELRGIAAYELEFQKNLIERVLRLNKSLDTPNLQTLTSVVNSRPFQGKLLRDWVTELDANKARRLRDAIRMGVVQGESIEEIIARVRGTAALNYRDGILEIGRRGAEALVRTAVAHTTSAARDLLFAQNRDIIAKEQWVATLDSRVCLTCAGRDGTFFEVGKGARTPAHIGCRCIRVPVLKSWQELGLKDLPPDLRSALDGRTTKPESFDQWLKRQSISVQNAVLGPTRANLYRNGQSLDSFTNRAGDALTLEQLRARAA